MNKKEKYERGKKQFYNIFLNYYNFEETARRMSWTRKIMWNLEMIREKNLNGLWMQMKELWMKGLKDSEEYKELKKKEIEKDKKYQLLLGILGNGVDIDYKEYCRKFDRVVDKINEELEKKGLWMNDFFDVLDEKGHIAYDVDWNYIIRIFSKITKSTLEAFVCSGD